MEAKINGHKVVFEGDDWSIIKDKNATNDRYIACHVACTTKNQYEHGIMSWFHVEEIAHCYYCGDDVPAEIQALVHLAASF